MKQLQIKETNTVKIKYRTIITAVIICVACVSISACNNKSKNDTQGENVTDDSGKKDGDNIGVDKNENNTNIDSPEVTPEDTNNELNNPNSITTPVINNNSEKPTVTKPQTATKDSSFSAYWTKLDGCVKAGQNYYNEYFTKTRIITMNGYLYNYAAGTQITTSYLYNEGVLDSQYYSDNISLMLMYGNDILNKGGSNLHMTDTDKKELTVFSFMKIPNESKYIFTSANGSFGTISESAYYSIVNAYSMDNGTVQRIAPSNGEYDRILSCIKMYESKYEQYFVRSITIDDKYAFVVLSGRANAATIREYILKYDNGIWEVIMDDLEMESRLPVVVNKKLPDFNTSLLPKYSLKDYKGSMLTDYTAIIDSLTKSGYFAKEDTFYYFCGTSDYCYMITDSGKRFLSKYDGANWESYKVLDYYDALGRLQNWSNNPPTFILLDLE